MRFGAAKRITPAAKPQISGFRAGCEALAAAAAGFIFNWAFLLSRGFNRQTLLKHPLKGHRP
jgi:hypothetical protein